MPDNHTNIQKERENLSFNLIEKKKV